VGKLFRYWQIFPSGVFVGKSVMVCAKVRRTPYLGKAWCYGSMVSLD
jgi:hypothetical protein